MKKNVIISMIGIIVICIAMSCENKTKSAEESSKTSDAVTEQVVVPTNTSPDTTQKSADSVPVIEAQKIYKTLVIDTKIPVELYESDTIQLPSDSILQLAGIVISAENNNVINIKTDSTIIPDEITIQYKKKKTLVTQLGITTEYVNKRVSIDNNGILLVDEKPILPGKALTVLRIGVPTKTPIVWTGYDNTLNATVALGKVTINASGNSSVSLSDIESAESISTKDGANITIQNTEFVQKLSATDSASIRIAKCDSIYSVALSGKAVLKIPETTPIAREKSTGNSDIVKQ